jgi:hypothetical protein
MCKSIQRFMNYDFCGHYSGLSYSCKMNWHYFCTRHGKGELDGAIVIVKRVNAPLSGPKVVHVVSTIFLFHKF